MTYNYFQGDLTPCLSDLPVLNFLHALCPATETSELHLKPLGMLSLLQAFTLALCWVPLPPRILHNYFDHLLKPLLIHHPLSLQ